MPAEVIEGVQRDIVATKRWPGWFEGERAAEHNGYVIALGRSEARQLVSEAILACERFEEWRSAAPSALPQLHVLSRVAALLLCAGAGVGEKPPAAVVQAAKDAYDVEAASMGGQCCEPYAAEVDEVSEELQRAYDQRDAAQEQARVWSDAADRERARAKVAESELRRLMAGALDARNAARAAETRFGELLGRVAELKRQANEEARLAALASDQAALAGQRSTQSGRARGYRSMATRIERVLADYEDES